MCLTSSTFDYVGEKQVVRLNGFGAAEAESSSVLGAGVVGSADSGGALVVGRSDAELFVGGRCGDGVGSSGLLGRDGVWPDRV
jgi:hypothetical protein